MSLKFDDVRVSVCHAQIEIGPASKRVMDTSSKHAKNIVFTYFSQEKTLSFLQSFLILFTIFFAIFSCIGLIIPDHQEK